MVPVALRRLSGGVVLLALLLGAAGCASSHEAGSWVVRSASRDGRVLRLGVDVSCSATIDGSRVHEYADRVSIELDVHAPGGNCKASLDVRELAVRLRSPLGTRWVDGACAGGCPGTPGRAALRCAIDGPPFGLGYLPSGWLTAHERPARTAAAYQSATGDATVALRHGPPDGTERTGTEQLVVLGTLVPLDTVPGGYAVTLHLAGAGPACGQWLVTGHGIDHDTFSTIVEQLFPR